MTPDQGELLSAFFDGVAVDPEQLAEALADPDARALLVTSARLRAEIRGDERRPSLAFYERMHAVLKPRGIRRVFRASVGPVPWPIAVGSAVAMLIAGLWTGLWVDTGWGARVRAPMAVLGPTTTGPAPVTRPAPIAQPSPSGGGSALPATPPPPTRELRFTPIGEWREGSS